MINVPVMEEKGQARGDALLRIDGVGISFQGVKALEEVSFDVPRGGVTSVIGPNGAGKTTLFNCITGLYRSEGQISLAGRPLDRLASHDRVAAGISRTFQTPALLDDATVLDNVLLGAHARTAAGFWRCAARSPLARREERRSARRSGSRGPSRGAARPGRRRSPR